MPTRDDELSRKLKSAARPVAEPDFRALIRIKEKHDRTRKVQRGAVALAVLASFALFVFVLNRAGSPGPHPATQAPTPSSTTRISDGKIVLVRQVQSRGGELWTVEPDGSEQELTDGSNDADPAVSPDGEIVAFSRSAPSDEVAFAGTALYTVPINGGTPLNLLDP